MSDMTETRVGTITATEDRYVAWKSTDGDYSETQIADWKTTLEGMSARSGSATSSATSSASMTLLTRR
jgi:type I restriction enzyme R subunit